MIVGQSHTLGRITLNLKYMFEELINVGVSAQGAATDPKGDTFHFFWCFIHLCMWVYQPKGHPRP